MKNSKKSGENPFLQHLKTLSANISRNLRKNYSCEKITTHGKRIGFAFAHPSRSCRFSVVFNSEDFGDEGCEVWFCKVSVIGGNSSEFPVADKTAPELAAKIANAMMFAKVKVLKTPTNQKSILNPRKHERNAVSPDLPKFRFFRSLANPNS